MSTFARVFNSICEMESFEEQLRKDLHQFLLSMNEVDERMPECPDAPAT